MSEKVNEDFRSNNICQFCETNVETGKVRDHCHITGKYRGRAHQIYNINVTRKQRNFISFAIHNFSNYD